MIDVLCVGHASFDITMSAPHHPEANEKMFADDIQLCGGGPAANAAVQVARLSGKAGLCAYLGNDPLGEAHANELMDEGVDTRGIVRGAHTTPVSQILAKPDGSRSVINFKGDTPWLPAGVLDETTLDALAPRIVLFDGHEPLISASICTWAMAHNIPTVLDAGSLHRGTRELTARVDHLVASEKFARQFTGTEELPSALNKLGKIADTVVITSGESGLLWQHENQQGKLNAFDIRAVDSTGAGDAFHGAYALALARAYDWQKTLRFASAAGALACTRLGARSALPDSKALSALLTQLS